MNVSASETGCMGSLCGVPRAPCISTVPVRSAAFTATRISRNVRDGEVVKVTLPATDAYFLMVYLDAAVHADLNGDEAPQQPRRFESDTVCLVDLCAGASIALHSTLRSIAVVLPKPLLAEVEGIHAIGCRPMAGPPRLVCRRGEADPVIANIAGVLLPLFDRDEASSASLFRHIATAICAHLLHNFSERPDPSAKDGAAGTIETGGSNHAG
ncbi:hypothetical protein [Paracoccus benzoatiresistens]|uniref:Uncharacterized protein n=1 Tax=Paracoccus benzoatiresistens TaxID=2997341 RepID=A0ABT4J9T8_9RHOB|nr:hypothetical protein [Paracoccus sp. EF6]MCZ0963842.1 hypothetical protein [Paracoccus sp. EF6]